MCCSTFVPNDVQSNNSYGRIKILTGPNACGKSIYLKQVDEEVYMSVLWTIVYFMISLAIHIVMFNFVKQKAILVENVKCYH